MFCPRCGREFEPDVSVCPECGIEVVAERPAAVDEAEWVDLVTLAETTSEPEILVVKSLLEAEGIRCFLEGEGIQELMGAGRAGIGTNLAIGPVRIQVRPEDAEAARELLEARDRGEPAEDEPAGPDPDTRG